MATTSGQPVATYDGLCMLRVVGSHQLLGLQVECLPQIARGGGGRGPARPISTAYNSQIWRPGLLVAVADHAVVVWRLLRSWCSCWRLRPFAVCATDAGATGGLHWTYSLWVKTLSDLPGWQWWHNLHHLPSWRRRRSVCSSAGWGRKTNRVLLPMLLVSTDVSVVSEGMVGALLQPSHATPVGVVPYYVVPLYASSSSS